MPAFFHVLKTILVPLFLALALYLFLAHLLLPFIRRHRTHYTQYLPLSSLAPTTTTSWRTTLSDALYNLFVPASWAARLRQHRYAGVHESGGSGHEDELFDDEEGEGMVGFDPIDERRREALEQRRSLAVGEQDRRLSRELEEGFKDDSGSEDESGDGGRR